MITSININNANDYTVLYTSVTDGLNAVLEDDSIIWPTTMDGIDDTFTGYKKICAKLKLLKTDPLYSSCWEGEKIKINSLDAYFHIIEDLVDEKPQYGILPLDEPPFRIDANTRFIDIPRGFTGVQIQGDHHAEVIYFEIDRYFDTTDLYGEDIYIQWERPDGVRGYSRPWIKDVESKAGKILFGWALTSSITEVPGNVKFSVRFLSKEGNHVIKYSLTTLTAILAINSGLVLDFS